MLKEARTFWPPVDTRARRKDTNKSGGGCVAELLTKAAPTFMQPRARIGLMKHLYVVVVVVAVAVVALVVDVDADVPFATNQ